jgi:hypothetical protein
VEFEEGLERLSRVVAQAAGREASWVARVRAGLVALLGFLEDEPGWAQLLFLASPNGDARAREQRATGVLTVLLNDGSPQAIGEIALAPRLAAELVAGGVFAVMRSHVHEACMGEAGTLVELAPSLMAFVVLPYLGLGAAEAELLGGSPSPGEARGDMSFQACVDAGRMSSRRRRTRIVREPEGFGGWACLDGRCRGVSRGRARVRRSIVIERIKE